MTYEDARVAAAAALVSMACLTATVACSAGAANEDSETFASMAASALDDAGRGGASDAQMGVLEAASRDGVMSLELARQAARSSISCMNDAGVEATYAEEELKSGLIVPGYTARLGESDDGASVAIVDACDRQEFAWVFRLYSLQPTSQAQKDAYVLSRESELRACLTEMGVVTDPELDGLELLEIANQAWLDGDTGGVDCAEEAGAY